MKQKLSKKIAYWLGVIVVGIILGLAIQFVRAWTEPGSEPPSGNLGAPINTGGNPQTKQGVFNSNTSVGAPTLCIGSDCRTSWPSGGSGTVSCPCGACGSTYSSEPYVCYYPYFDGYAYGNETTTYVCTTGGWACSSNCDGCQYR